MPKKIILVRHGQTDWNEQRIIQGHTDTFLNKEGLKQAVSVAEKLKNEKIDAIFSSDLKRAYHTALVIAQKLKKKVKTSKLLRERYFGNLQGLRGEEIAKRYSLEISEQYWSWRTTDTVIRKVGLYYTEIETDEEMFSRHKRFFQTLIRQYKGKNVLLVTHGGSIWSILRVLGLDKQIQNAGHFKNTSITVIGKTSAGYKIYVLNR